VCTNPPSRPWSPRRRLVDLRSAAFGQDEGAVPVRENSALAELVYSMTVSLDGFIAGPNGEIDWSAPDEELHRFHNRRVAALDAHLLGRRLYETMTYWDTVEEASLRDYETEFARLWKSLPKVVFSKTLTEVGANARLAGADAVAEVERLKGETGGEIGVGGAGLASALIERDLVDEFQLFVSPVVLGEGIPYFPPLARRLDLELVDTRAFGGRVVYLAYRRRRS